MDVEETHTIACIDAWDHTWRSIGSSHRIVPFQPSIPLTCALGPPRIITMYPAPHLRPRSPPEHYVAEHLVLVPSGPRENSLDVTGALEALTKVAPHSASLRKAEVMQYFTPKSCKMKAVYQGLSPQSSFPSPTQLLSLASPFAHFHGAFPIMSARCDDVGPGEPRLDRRDPIQVGQVGALLLPLGIKALIPCPVSSSLEEDVTSAAVLSLKDLHSIQEGQKKQRGFHYKVKMRLGLLKRDGVSRK